MKMQSAQRNGTSNVPTILITARKVKRQVQGKAPDESWILATWQIMEFLRLHYGTAIEPRGVNAAGISLGLVRTDSTLFDWEMVREGILGHLGIFGLGEGRALVWDPKLGSWCE